MGQLEIITPAGDIFFYTLNSQQGITNIGRHPSNDIVLHGPDVVEFHAMLDHRQRPYQFMLLVTDGSARISASPLSPNVYCDLHNWDTIELGGITLLYVDNEQSAPSPATHAAAHEANLETLSAVPTGVSTPSSSNHPTSITDLHKATATPPAAAADESGHRRAVEQSIAVAPLAELELARQILAESPAGPEGEELAAAENVQDADHLVEGARDLDIPGQPIQDETDDIIVLDISEPEQIVDVEQNAAWQLTIINGGPIVATFHIHVDGWIHDEWIVVAPSTVNLNEGERATVQVTITPPKSPDSLAGLHHIAFVVTSPNYADRRSLRGATLLINPFYEFAVGELTPKQQTVSYFQQCGHLSVPLQNKSNARATFRLDGTDDQMGTTFEFLPPGQEAPLVRQAELKLDPKEEISIPIQITPNVKKMVGAGSRSYSLTVTTTLVESDQAPRATLGQLKSKPLVGPLIITALALCIAVAVLAMMRPSISAFGFVPETVQAIDASDAGAGQAESPASNIPDPASIKPPKFLGIKVPKLPKQLKLVTKMLDSFGFSLSGDPEAEEEQPNATAKTRAGSEVALFWQTSRSASSLSIGKEIDGNVQPFQPAVAGPTGQLSFVADGNAVYILRAENWIVNLPIVGGIFGFDERKVVLVTDPLIPEIVNFEVDNESVVTGEPVTVRWNIQNADTYTLQINGIPQTLTEANGVMEYEPNENTTFTLIADSPYATGSVQKPLQVIVSTPTPTPVPTPVIAVFGASPNSIVAGESVRLDWSVEGADTVTIDPLGPAASIEGFREEVLAEAKTWVFTLNADKGGSTNSRSIQVKVVAPTATPSPTPTPQVPVVQVFDIIPNEVVAGSDATKDVKAKWTIVGDYTDIQISSPDFGPVANLARDGTMKLPGNKSTVYQITVFLGDDVATSLTKELTVLEPTPTNTPEPTATATPTPTLVPNIVYFKASGDSDKISFDDSSSKYKVVAGTEVNLSWQVRNATEVILVGEGPQPLEVLEFLRTINSDVTFTLQANSGDGSPQNAFVVLEAIPPPPPPIVSGVTGQYSNPETAATVYWAYGSEVQDDIIGFRIYRASTGDFVFVRVADWAVLTSAERQWQDTLTPSCGQAYYVVAVYENVTLPEDSRIQETAISNETWITQPCP